MPVASSLTTTLMYSTVRISNVRRDGKLGAGTAFFFRLKENNEKGTHVPVLMTNKHVIEQANTGELRFRCQDAEGNVVPNKSWGVGFEKFEADWTPHPDNNVDLCYLPFAPILRVAEKQGIQIHFRSIGKKDIPSQAQLEELKAVEEILMVGYPIGLFDEINNLPIYRRGITATHPAFKYNGKEEFLIDAACFPGSSGSPVFIASEGIVHTPQGLNLGSSRFYFMGVLYAGPQWTADGTLEVVNVPTAAIPIARIKIPINIGVVIQAYRILEFDKL